MAEAPLCYVRSKYSYKMKLQLNAHRYITGVLIPHVQSVLTALGENFISVNDNTCVHHSGDMETYMQEVGIRSSDWSSKCVPQSI